MKKNPVAKLLLTLSLLGGGAFIDSSRANLAVYESFNYPLGTVAPDPDGGLNGGNGLVFPASTGLRAVYHSSLTTVEGLNYNNSGGTLSTLANALKRTSGTSWGDGVPSYRFMAEDPFSSYRSISDPAFFGWNGNYATEMFYSILLNASAINNGSNNRVVTNLGVGANNNHNTYFSQNGEEWAYADDHGTTFTYGPAIANETVLFVCRLGFDSATSLVTDYWFNPILGQPLGEPSFSKTYSFAATSGGRLRTVLQPRDGGTVMTFDEFRLGTTSNSVLPMVGVVAPAAPSTLTASSALFSEANLTWADNSSNETEFIIDRSPNGTDGWRQVGRTAANTASFQDTGLFGNTTYFYRVHAENGGGSSAFSNATSVTTPRANAVTPPPTGLAGTADSFSEISLTFIDNSSSETGFLVERSLDGTTDWSAVVTLAADITSYQNVELAADTTYYYRVTALVGGNNSVPSTVASVTTPALPAAVALDPIYLPFEDPADTPIGSATVLPGFNFYSGSGVVSTNSALSYPGLKAPLGNGLESPMSNRFYLSLDTTLPGLANYVSGGQIGGSGLGVLYVRWLASGVKGQEANTIDFRTESTDIGTERASVGTTFGNDFIRLISDSDGNGVNDRYVDSPLTPSVGTDLYVARFTFASDGNTTLDLFVNQLTEGTPDGTVIGKIKFNTIGFSKFGGTTPPSLDEFRIATSFSQAVDASGAGGGAYANWAAGTFAKPFSNTGAGVDFDLDGLTNLLEFVLGGDPTINDTPSISPAVTTPGSNMVVTFKRSDISELEPVTVKVQVSADLVTWNPADDITIGAGPAGTGPNGATYTVDDAGTMDSVIVTIPRSGAPKKFVRIRARYN